MPPNLETQVHKQMNIATLFLCLLTNITRLNLQKGCWLTMFNWVSYDNRCFNAKLYFTPPRHESSDDNRCLNVFLLLMVCFNSIYWYGAILRIFMVPGFLCSGAYGKKHIYVLFSYVTEDALCDALGNCRKVLQSLMNFKNIFLLVWIISCFVKDFACLLRIKKHIELINAKVPWGMEVNCSIYGYSILSTMKS